MKKLTIALLFVGLFLAFSWAVAAELKGTLDVDNDGRPDIFIFQHEDKLLSCHSTEERKDFYIAHCYDQNEQYYKYQAVPYEQGWLKDLPEDY